MNYLDHNKRAFTIDEAADYACVSRGTIENWMAKGILPYEELPSGGNGVYSFKRIRKVDIDGLLDDNYICHLSEESSVKKKAMMNSNAPFLLPK